MKKFGVKLIIALAVLVLAATGSVSAQERGDLFLSIDPQFGVNFPSKDIWDNAGMFLGIDYAVTANAVYYLAGFFSVNAGMGVEGTLNNFYDKLTGSGRSSRDLASFISDQAGRGKGGSSLGDPIGNLSTMYFSIPFGARLSLGFLSIGGGLKWNILMKSSGGFDREEDYQGNKYTNNISFKVKSYMGWYADLGFASSKGGLFSWALQISDSFTGNITAVQSTDQSSLSAKMFEPFKLFTVSLVYRLKIPLAKIPIGNS